MHPLQVLVRSCECRMPDRRSGQQPHRNHDHDHDHDGPVAGRGGAEGPGRRESWQSIVCCAVCVDESCKMFAATPVDGGVSGRPAARVGFVGQLFRQCRCASVPARQTSQVPDGRACCPTASCLATIEGQVSNGGWQLGGRIIVIGQGPRSWWWAGFTPPKARRKKTMATLRDTGISARHGTALEERH